MNQYFFEYVLLASTMCLTVSGFWNIYVGPNAEPNRYHHLHVVTNLIWLCLVVYQLSLIGRSRNNDHRRVGLAILVMAPLLVATTALLSVRSAHKGVISGEGDFLIVQNVGVTLELGALVLLAFVFRKRRRLHGSFLLSTSILFMGIALFFTLVSFVPPFNSAGPDISSRFQAAGITGQVTCVVVGFLFFVKDFRNGWPFALAGGFFILNELIRSSLTKSQLIEPLTEFVGSMSPAFTFVGTFALVLGLLVATGILNSRRRRGLSDIEMPSPALDRLG